MLRQLVRHGRRPPREALGETPQVQQEKRGVSVSVLLVRMVAACMGRVVFQRSP